MKNYADSLPCRGAFKRLASPLLLLLVTACAGGGDEALVCASDQVERDGVCVCTETGKAAVGGICVTENGLPPLQSTLVDGGGDTGNGIGLDLDANDYPHLAYYEVNNGDLRYATVSARTGKWTIETIDRNGDVGRYPSLALYGAEGAQSPVVVYYDSDQKALKGAVRVDGQWKTRFLDPEVDNGVSPKTGTFTSIAVAEKDGEAAIAHVAYIDEQNADLRYLQWNLETGDVLVSEQADPGFDTIDGIPYGSGVIGEHTSIAIDGDGRPVIAYRDVKNADLKVAVRNDDGMWSRTFVDNDPLTEVNYGNMGRFASIGIDDIGNYHVAYLNESDKDLRYAHFDGSDWAIETVVRGGVGGHVSLTLRDDRTPMVAYFDNGRGAAAVAHRRRDGRWQIEYVATSGVSGLYARLQVTRQGWPALAWQDFIKRQLFFDYITWVVFP